MEKSHKLNLKIRFLKNVKVQLQKSNLPKLYNKYQPTGINDIKWDYNVKYNFRFIFLSEIIDLNPVGAQGNCMPLELPAFKVLIHAKSSCIKCF